MRDSLSVGARLARVLTRRHVPSIICFLSSTHRRSMIPTIQDQIIGGQQMTGHRKERVLERDNSALLSCVITVVAMHRGHCTGVHIQRV